MAPTPLTEEPAEEPEVSSSQLAAHKPTFKERLKEAFNFKEASTAEKIFTAVFFGIVGLMLFIYVYTFLFNPSFLTWVIIRFFVIPVRSIGAWGYLLFFGIMMLQCIVAPIPSELVQIVAGLIFGFVLGSFMSLAGIMITAFIGFTIADKGGRPVVEKAVGTDNVEALDRFINKYGIWAMIVGRGIPFIPFDTVTYGAGLVRMSKRDYFAGTLIGTIPRSFFYGYIGSILFPGGVDEILTAYNSGSVDLNELIDQAAGSFNLILTLTILIVVGGFAVFQFVIMPLGRKRARKRTESAPAVGIGKAGQTRPRTRPPNGEGARKKGEDGRQAPEPVPGSTLSP